MDDKNNVINLNNNNTQRKERGWKNCYWISFKVTIENNLWQWIFFYTFYHSPIYINYLKIQKEKQKTIPKSDTQTILFKLNYNFVFFTHFLNCNNDFTQ